MTGSAMFGSEGDCQQASGRLAGSSLTTNFGGADRRMYVRQTEIWEWELR